MNSPEKPAAAATVRANKILASIACQDCSLYPLCLPAGIPKEDLEKLDSIIERRRPMQRGVYLYQSGEPMRSIYAVHSGSLKTSDLTEDGREQVTGFYLPGEILGFEAIASGRHVCTATALETTSVCEIPFADLELLGEAIPQLPRQLMAVMSQKIQHDQRQMMLLGKRSADARLAAFLFSLSERFGQRGYSSSEFNLSMSRNDIGNFLGLAVETISRLFSRLQDEGVLAVQGRHVHLLDPAHIRTLAGQQ